jgi:Zn-dependent protease
MNEIIQIFGFLVLIFSIVIHEFSHGWVADQLGDPTARYAGRLTLNPIPHIDPVGSILLPLILLLSGTGFIVGWAKPVPYNPYNLKDQKKGPALVALAGPAANLLIATIFGVIIRILAAQNVAAYANIIDFFAIIVIYNILLAVFNLVPLPPLDGSKILAYFLPSSWHGIMDTLEKNYFIFLIIFVLFGFQYITPIIDFIFGIIVGNVLGM